MGRNLLGNLEICGGEYDYDLPEKVSFRPRIIPVLEGDYDNGYICLEGFRQINEFRWETRKQRPNVVPVFTESNQDYTNLEHEIPYMFVGDSRSWVRILVGKLGKWRLSGMSNKSFRRIGDDLYNNVLGSEYCEVDDLQPLRQAARKAREVRRNHPRNSRRYMGRPY